MKIQKIVFLIICSITYLSCNKVNEGFTVNGEIANYDEDYLYMSYQDKRDSIFVKGGKFKFEGKVDYPVSVGIRTEGNSYASRNFFLENSPIEIKLSVEKKIFEDFTANLVNIENVDGSKTDELFTEFEQIRLQDLNTDDWRQKLFLKSREILTQNPNNEITGSVLSWLANRAILDNQKLRELYGLMNWEYQSVITHNKLRPRIFPEDYIDVGNTIYDFELFDENNIAVNTKKFRDSYVLIDFWASWCGPCIEEFPELLKIYNQHKPNGFKVIGVSIDKDREKWVKALERYSLEWHNVISSGEGKNESELALKYKATAVPTNFLIDKNGVVLEKDISLYDLNLFLNENLE